MVLKNLLQSILQVKRSLQPWWLQSAPGPGVRVRRAVVSVVLIPPLSVDAGVPALLSAVLSRILTEEKPKPQGLMQTQEALCLQNIHGFLAWLPGFP